MKVLILGADGYIGRPLAVHLREQGHSVIGVDNFSRRRLAKYNLTKNLKADCIKGDVTWTNWMDMDSIDAVVHLAQQPSAPYSMKNSLCAIETQRDNIAGTLNILWAIARTNPKTHLVKLGTMGEYGTPEIDIPEGFIEDACLLDKKTACPYGNMMFPRKPGSFYHLSKVFDTMNIEFACRIWGLRATDIMQGVVFGLNHWDPLKDITRFDYDEIFGTVINRFCVQAIAQYPLTVYGAGGQTRGFLPLQDSLECLTLAIENPPQQGQYRVFNQYAKTYDINTLAQAVKDATEAVFPSKKVEIDHVANPRVEMEKHTYETTNENLRQLGYNPKWELKKELQVLISILKGYEGNIDTKEIHPKTRWR